MSKEYQHGARTWIEYFNNGGYRLCCHCYQMSQAIAVYTEHDLKPSIGLSYLEFS